MMLDEPRLILGGRLRIISMVDGKIYPEHCRRVDNLITTIGKNLAAEALGVGFYGFLPNTKAVQYCALGDTDSPPPAVTDVGLANELCRLPITDALREANIIYFDTFFGNDDANFTIREAGLFGYAATATPGSGWLLCRTISFAPIIKTTAETLTFSWGMIFST